MIIFRGQHVERIIELFEDLGEVIQVGLFGVKRIVFIAGAENIKHLFQSPIYEKGKDANAVMHDVSTKILI